MVNSNELPQSIQDKYASKLSLRPFDIKVIVLRHSYLVWVIGSSSIKVHHWVYRNGWTLCKGCCK